MSKIIGMESLVKKLNALGSMKGQVMLDSCVAGGLEISNGAKDLCPRITSTLYRSIHIGGELAKSSPNFTPNDEGGTYTDMGGKEVSNTKVTIQIGTNLVYAARIEYGFSGADKLGRVYHQPAQPYLRPAIDTKEQKCYDQIAYALTILINKATK